MRGAIASCVAILLASAILFAFVLPILLVLEPRNVFFSGALFLLVIPAATKFDWVLLGSAFRLARPFLAASFGRAPPALVTPEDNRASVFSDRGLLARSRWLPARIVGPERSWCFLVPRQF